MRNNSIYRISFYPPYKTINMNRYRLRKSLNLSSEEDLTDYLQNI